MRSFAIAGGLFLTLTTANAAPIVLHGANVEYSFSETFTSLFGTPFVDGNSLKLSPTNFSVLSTEGFNLTHGTTPLVTVNAKSGYLLTGVNLLEQGSYFRIEDLQSSTFVSATGQFIVNDIPYNIVTDQKTDVVFSVADLLSGNSVLTPTTWTLSESIGLTATDSFTFKLQNLLLAAVIPNNGSGFSFIEKKLIKVDSLVSPVAVPVPSTIWLFVSGAFVLLNKRKSSAENLGNGALAK